jgi:(4-O-methyl)-D-glucuronate---lignin esterase
MQSAPHPRLWTAMSEEARGFSGTGVYRHQFTLSEDDVGGRKRMMLDLGEVRDIARVILNGADCGIAWTPPFRVEVTAALRADENLLEVHVTNPWRNRLIAESGAPTGSVFRPMTEVFEATALPLPAGLAGPVRLVRED